MARKPKATAPAPDTAVEQAVPPPPTGTAETSLAQVIAPVQPAETATTDNSGSTDDGGQAGADETGKDPADAPAPGAEPQGVLIVIGPKRGRWRAGRHFGPEAVNIPLGDLTPDAFTAIVNDEKLSISVIYPDAET